MPFRATPPLPPEQVARLRTLYESCELPVSEILKREGVTYYRLKQAAEAGRWRRRTLPSGLGPKMRRRKAKATGLESGAPAAFAPHPCTGLAACSEREALVARLWASCEAQVADCEARLRAASGEADTLAHDRAARTLAVLVRTLERLTALDRAALEPKSDDDDAVPRDLDELRAELARRLDRLREPGADPANPGGA